jgi:predicted RNase H-like HicB family nuclease
MQYQVFVQNPTDHIFMASVFGLPNLTANGITEKEGIDRLKGILDAQFKHGKLSRSTLIYLAIDRQKKAILGLPTWRFFKTIRHLMTF